MVMFGRVIARFCCSRDYHVCRLPRRVQLSGRLCPRKRPRLCQLQRSSEVAIPPGTRAAPARACCLPVFIERWALGVGRLLPNCRPTPSITSTRLRQGSGARVFTIHDSRFTDGCPLTSVRLPPITFHLSLITRD